MLPSFGDYEKTYYKHQCTGFLCEHKFSLICVKSSSVNARSYSKSMFSFVRNHQTVFQSGCFILHFHQQWMKVSLLHIFNSVLDFSHANRCIVVYLVLICSFLMTYDVNYLFIWVFVIYIPSLVRYPDLCPLFNWVFIFLFWGLRVFFVCILNIRYIFILYKMNIIYIFIRHIFVLQVFSFGLCLVSSFF